MSWTKPEPINDGNRRKERNKEEQRKGGMGKKKRKGDEVDGKRGKD